MVSLRTETLAPAATVPDRMTEATPVCAGTVLRASAGGVPTGGCEPPPSTAYRVRLPKPLTTTSRERRGSKRTPVGTISSPGVKP